MIYKRVALWALVFTMLSTLISTSSYAMTDMGGKQANLSKFIGKGKWLIVEAWHSRCRACMKSMPELVRAKGTFPNAQLVGVSLDGNRGVALKTFKRFKVNFPTFVTNTREFDRFVRRVAKRPLKGAPTYLIFSPSGKLKAMQTGNISPKAIRRYISQQQRYK
ncbi:MAG: TlpA family protein disulfide reductase [Thiotrichaceae bacterium]|nr:TlpA family protein disulfide reductase [Thiotrichaceae bacterium]